MLTHLSIQNYALIRQLEIDFTPGFTVITGETGAGKSILLGALNLMLGKRAETQVLFDKTKKCIVEGMFTIAQYNLHEFFAANDLEYDNQAIVRREIGVNGKSRAFINDTPVNLDLLKDFAGQLIDIHSQHQTVTLNDANFQLSVIDNFAGISDLVKKYRVLYQHCIQLKDQLDLLVQQENKSKSEQDYFEFLFKELDSAKFTAGEQEQLEGDLKVINHAEEIKSHLNFSSQSIGGEELGILTKLNEVRSNLNQISGFSDALKELASRLEGSYIELSDILNEIDKIADSVVYQPEKANEIKERLDLIYHLQNKHRVNSIEDLLLLKEELNTKLNNIASIEDKIKTLGAELLQKEQEVIKEAKKISDLRKKHFTLIEKEIEATLSELGMPHARFSIFQQLIEFPGKDGFDTVKFLFNANKGGELQEMSKVASGGELSRLMLAVKSLISQKNLLPTIIFDEIDIGVSGQVADKVGTILSKLSAAMQVIAITHLPQIAGKGNTHFFVYKETDSNTTKTEIKVLNPDERIIEIAKMLSGEDVTPASVESAKHLIK
jgi:DNA repair protein RecN (Recombination protein N)